MVQAHGAGRIDFASWSGSKQDFLRLRFAVQVEEEARIEKIEQLEATRCIMMMLLPGTDQSLMPWLSAAVAQNRGDAVDDILDWYAEFRPDLLEAALKNG